MSTLKKTILVPNTDPKTILDQKILKLVVITDDLKLVEKANNLALDTPPNVDRFVIWYKIPDFATLKEQYPLLPEDLKQVKAFSLSTNNKIADIITTNDIIDYVLIDRAFTKAGLPEFN